MLNEENFGVQHALSNNWRGRSSWSLRLPLPNRENPTSSKAYFSILLVNRYLYRMNLTSYVVRSPLALGPRSCKYSFSRLREEYFQNILTTMQGNATLPQSDYCKYTWESHSRTSSPNSLSSGSFNLLLLAARPMYRVSCGSFAASLLATSLASNRVTNLRFASGPFKVFALPRQKS